jgi:hypothetical protein
MTLDASARPLRQFQLGEGRQQPGRRPALAVGALGELRPEPGDGGQTQLAEQEGEARGVDGDRLAHAPAPVAGSSRS